jgi:Do/DeqQ family serine protease
MKQTIKLFSVALVAGAVSVGGYKIFESKTDSNYKAVTTALQPINFTPTKYTLDSSNKAVDFSLAAEKTVDAVVHVISTSISKTPTTMMEYIRGNGRPTLHQGSGSGVIISPDGYIITNNHVIDNASQLEVTLNDNTKYTASVVGTDPKTGIALLKIESDNLFPYIAFSDSNNVKLGEWVLAVGNPFRLTSTVTAGIVSAKSRDLDQTDGKSQSFIQTDAAVNRGNSGGALVNTKGDLIGINTAITSQTGSYVGYSFAVPSNIARKVVEDILEFGEVQQAILGISASSLNSEIGSKLGINQTKGVFVAGIEKGGAAEKGGLKKGDVIIELDGVEIGKFADLTGYLGSKRPNDTVGIKVIRNGNQQVVEVKLKKLEVYEIKDIGIEVAEVLPDALKRYNINGGVSIKRVLRTDISRFALQGNIITKLDDIAVKNINDVREIINNRDASQPIKMTFINKKAETFSYIFR